MTNAITSENITPGTSERSLLEEQEKQTGKFAIDILPIENREDKLSYITNLSIITRRISNSDLNKLGMKNRSGSYYIGVPEGKKNFLLQQARDDGCAFDSDREQQVGTLIGSGWLLFKAKDITVNGDYIIIEDFDNDKYMGKFEEYLTQGIKALRIVNDGEINRILAEEKLRSKFSHTGSLLSINASQRLEIGADDYCITDQEKNEFCILKDNKIAIYTYTDSIERQSDYFDLSAYGNIKNIKTDINNNFYFIICEKQGEQEGETISELKVLNRKTLQEVSHFENLTEIIYLSNDAGKLFCMDKDGYLRIITINTTSLPRGYVDTNELSVESEKASVVKIEDKPRSDLKQVLSTGGLTLSHDGNSIVNTEDEFSDDIELRKQIWNTTVDGLDNKTLRELFDEATSAKDITIVYQLALQLKKNPHIMAVDGLIDPIIHEISLKKEAILLSEMGKRLTEIASTIADANDFPSLVNIKNTLQDIKQQRSQIIAVDKDVDALLRDTIKIIEEKISEYQSEHKEQIVTELEESANRISAYMENIDFLPQVTSIYSSDLWKNAENMISYLDEEERKKWKKKLSGIVTSRQVAITKNIKDKEKSQLQLQEETIHEIQADITSLKGIVSGITNEESLTNMESTDPLVISIKTRLNKLPEHKAVELEQKLSQIFKERLLSIQYSKESTSFSLKSLDQYGIPKSLYFVPDVIKKVTRDIEGKPTKDGKISLQFVSSNGNVIKPSINKKILGNFAFTYTFEERQELRKNITKWKSNNLQNTYKTLLSDPEKNKDKIAEIEKKYYVPRMLDVMDKITGEGKLWNLHTRNNLPTIDTKTVITPTIQESLAKRGRILSLQLQHKQGIMIVESEAGTGKNFKCDILGHLTNREVFDLSCNENMEKEDLLFSPEIDNEGTHRKPSKLIQGLQTPGAIIVFDEINTLKPGVAKLLNPLLDGRRYINDAQVGRVYAHPTVTLVGLMNPRYYRGTRQLPQEIVSRARMTDDKYPEKKEEAYMISKYVDGPISRLSWEEFLNYWEEYIDRQQVPTDKTIYNVVLDLKKVATVAEKIREEYSETMKGNADFDRELNYVFTIRDGNYVIQDYNYTKDIKQSIKDIVITKIAEPKEKDFANEIIENYAS